VLEDMTDWGARRSFPDEGIEDGDICKIGDEYFVVISGKWQRIPPRRTKVNLKVVSTKFTAREK
jgi:hypothetical protein